MRMENILLLKWKYFIRNPAYLPSFGFFTAEYFSDQSQKMKLETFH